MVGSLKSILILLLTVMLFSLSPVYGASREDGQILSCKSIGKKNGVVCEKIAYRSDGLKVMGMLFRGCGEGRRPCVIFCHDGISGISEEHRLSSVRIAREGYVVFSPSYRGEDGSEGQVEIAKGEVRDVLNAIIMVSKLECVDAKRIALVGASHGALISVLAASRTNKVRAVVTAYGVMDIYKWWYYLKAMGKLGNDGVTTKTYGKGPEDRPLSFSLRNGVTAVKSIQSPVLILQGELDTTVPPEQARSLKEALDAHNIPSEMKIYPNCAHGFLVYVPYLEDEDIDIRERQETETAWRDMLDFLRSHL